MSQKTGAGVPRHNILLITADQMRFDALACHAKWSPASGLAHAVQTPNLDRLASDGVTFTRAFTPNPICVPARASITTGNYSHTCSSSKDNDGTILGDQIKLAQLYADHGYATYAIGKLHYVPYNAPDLSRRLHGFQYAELHEEGRILGKFDPDGHLSGLEDYHDFLKDAGWEGYGRAHGAGNNDAHPVTSPLLAELHEEAWVADRTIAALQRHRQQHDDQPFLMWASFSKPHPPYDPPRPYDALYDPRELPPPMGDWDDETLVHGRDPELVRRRTIYGWERLSPQAVQVIRARYAGLVTFQDAMVGRLLDWLAEAGLSEDTIVVYTSDHGDLLGDFGRFFKRCMLDGAVRIPMIWRVPDLTSKTDTSGRFQMVGLQDILPTLCALTGVPLSRPVDGHDLTPALSDRTAPGREAFVSQTVESRGGGQKYMVLTDEWKYVYCEAGGVEELYDARGADGDLANLAGESRHAGTMAALREYLTRWCIEHGDHQMAPDGRLAIIPETTLASPDFSVNRLGWRRY